MTVGDITSTAKGSGARYNDGKPEYSLIPLIALRECARVFMYGRNKYDAWNWAKGMDWLIPYDCMMRHMEAWQRREENDPESGLSHLGHAMCNLVMLCFYALCYPQGDNRPPAELFTAEPTQWSELGEQHVFEQHDDFDEQFDEKLRLQEQRQAKS
jgi:hypothetical protein